MTCNVFGGTLNLAQSNLSVLCVTGDVVGLPRHQRSTVHGLHNDGQDDVSTGCDDRRPVLGEASIHAADILHRRPPTDVSTHEDQGNIEDQREAH